MQLREMVSKFASEEIAPRAEEIDQKNEFPLVRSLFGIIEICPSSPECRIYGEKWATLASWV